MKLYLASDHGGFKLKEHLKGFLEKQGHEVMDLGCSSGESCDYPDYAKKLAEKVAKEKAQGILCCGTGIGMCIAANKVKGIRAAVVWNEFTARAAKEHNNANIICLGERVLGEKEAEEIVSEWMNASFLGERHQKRIEKISKMEASR